METGDGVRAWRVLRRLGEYEAAWLSHIAPAAWEPGPFPIRIQSPADFEAARFQLLAWADPRAADGPISPFWNRTHMVEAALDSGAEPLAALVAAGGGTLEGLRLMDGGLVLKVEYAHAVVQLRLRDAVRFPGRRGRGPTPLRPADAADGAVDDRLLDRCGSGGSR